MSRPRWLVFFYSVPSRPASLRMRIWRRLMRLGAAQLKGSVYVLPFSDIHLEQLKWLSSHVEQMGGEAAFINASSIENISQEGIVDNFNRQREQEYEALEKKLHPLRRRLGGLRKASATARDAGMMAAELARIKKDFNEIQGRDFFTSSAGRMMQAAIEGLEASLAAQPAVTPPPGPSRSRREDFQGLVWVTRPRPFADRMASAWLIRNFIDPRAEFAFADEPSEGQVSFDTPGGRFTHDADLCTFETLIRSFSLGRDKRLARVARIVHDLDLKDNKFHSPEAPAIEELLLGIRALNLPDHEALARGMDIFALLYGPLKK